VGEPWAPVGIQPYVSRTGSGITLEALWEHDWRLLVNAHGVHRCEGFRFSIDPGVVEEDTEVKGSVKQRADWDPGRYDAVMERYGHGADWIAAPDIVAGGLASLRRSEAWLPRIATFAMPLIVVQDGMEPADLWPLVGPHCGVFIGGSTRWKLTTLPRWGQLSRARGCYLHVGRVNSAKRIALCQEAGAHSFDGRCALYVKHIPALTRAADNPSGQTTIHDAMET
jgi:hypothetical protein